MNPAQLLSHFDRISEAPDAITRLRRFILDLAVRGKLVEQDLRDEPASELLKRIKAERARLVKGGEKKKELLPELSDEERPFELPHGWCLVRFGVIYSLEYGDNLPAEKRSNTGEYPVYGSNGIVGSHSVCFVRDPCIVVGRKGSAGALNLSVTEGCCVTDVAYYCIPSRELDLIFSFKLFHTLGLDTLGKGIKPGLNRNEAYVLPLALPPLAEQQRIVAKVDELMALCDRLETAQTERESQRDRLAAASLHRLNNGADADAFREHARFYFNHLPRLTTRHKHIKQLRQTILNLAVRGQLVPQDPKDKPSPVFAIEKCAEEENRIQLRLPLGWSWARVEDVAEARLGKMLDKAKNSGKAYRYLRNTNIHWFDVRMDELKDLRIEVNEVEKYVLRNGDVLICEGGHGIGRTAVWRGMETNIIFQKALHRVRPGQALNSEFFAYCVCVYFHAGVLQSYFTGVGIPHFTGVALSKLVFPLPPIKEQHRIVAKVEELMALCDRLEAQLTTTQTESRRLLEAVLHEAISVCSGLKQVSSL